MEQGFTPFPKLARLSRDVIITEKIDGTNAAVRIFDTSVDLEPNESYPDSEPLVMLNQFALYAQSRNKFVRVGDDNAGFAGWVVENAEQLVMLGRGCHFGEWWGKGIQRNYAQTRKRFSLFNVTRWADPTVRPECCEIVPVLYKGPFDAYNVMVGVKDSMRLLLETGSKAAPGWMNPEGIVVYHEASNTLFKKTLVNDEKPKGQA